MKSLTLWRKESIIRFKNKLMDYIQMCRDFFFCLFAFHKYLRNSEDYANYTDTYANIYVYAYCK